MIGFILLALGLGAAFTAYEFSPAIHGRVDEFIRALRSAGAAHRAADAHLSNAHATAAIAARHAAASSSARQASPPYPLPPSLPEAPSAEPTVADAHDGAADAATDAAIDHAVAATEANQVAAQATAEAVQAAQTAEERQLASASAAAVIERAHRIAQALASLGVGQCGVHTYPRATERTRDALLTRLHAEGMGVTGDNPYNIDTQQYAVKLRAIWDPTKQAIKIIVTAGQGGLFGLVTCEEIWKKIDPIMKDVIR